MKTAEMCGGVAVCIFIGIGGAWIGHTLGYASGWVAGHNDGVAFAEKSTRLRESSAPVATEALVPERIPQAAGSISPSSADVFQQEVIGNDGRLLCTIRVLKRNLGGVLLEASTESTAGPCTGRQR